MSDNAIELLRAILGELRTMNATLRSLSAGSGAAPARAPSGGSSSGNGSRGGDVASDSDLDSEWGDPLIKYDPKEKYWKGRSYIGSHFSETEPAYLDAMASYYDACAYMAGKDGDAKKAVYKRKDAARARGWAARMRSGAVLPASRAEQDAFESAVAGAPGDDIPF